MRRICSARVEPALHFAVTEIVRAPSDAVWRVLGDFGTEHRWTKSVAECARDTREVRVGTVRSCRLPRPLMGRTAVRETLTEFAPGQALAYALEGPAGPFAFAASRWSTAPASADETAVTVEGTFRPANRTARFLVWPLAKPMVRRLARRVVRELDAFVRVPEPGRR